jgi:hypothetical protein
MNMFKVSKNLAGIEPLNGSNYGSWKMNLDIMLGCMDYDFVLTEPKPPTDESSATEKAHHVRWEKVNRLAMMIIRASIRESLRGGIATTKTSSELMSLIKNQFVGKKKSLLQIMNKK